MFNKILLALSLFLIILSPTFAWYPEYNSTPYRIPITVNSSINQTNYAFQINIPWNSTFNSDCSDIRVTNGSDTGKYSFWIETCNSTNITLWTKGNLTWNNGTQAYIYFGNPVSSSQVNMQDVFLIGDDFIGSNGTSPNASIWTQGYLGDSRSISYLDGTGNLVLYNPNAVSTSAYIQSIGLFSQGKIIEIKRKQSSNSKYLDFSMGNTGIGGSNWHATPQNGYAVFMNGVSSATGEMYVTFGTYTLYELNASYFTYGDATSFRVSKFILDTATSTLSYYVDGVLKMQAHNDTHTANTKNLILSQGEYTDGGGDTQYVDWVRVRDYSSSEPASTAGAIESRNGLYLNAFYSNGTQATNWNISIANSSSTYNNASVNNTLYLNWSSIPNGTLTLTIDDASPSSYYTQNISTISSSSGITTLNITLYAKSANVITLSSNIGWTLIGGQSPIISCTSAEGNTSLYIQGILVTSPHSFTISSGTYIVSCNSSYETSHYYPNTATNTLVANSYSGCTNLSIYAFSATVSTSTNTTTLNFTVPVSRGYVKPDLSDAIAENVSGSWINLTGASGQYLVVNNTNKTSFIIKFGNYLINNSYGNSSINNTQNISTFSNINPYAYINLIDEVSDVYSYPQTSSVVGYISCSQGQNYFSIYPNDTRILIALQDIPQKVSLRPQYSSTNYYSRSRYNFENLSSYIFNFYLADKVVYNVDPVVFIMQDIDKQAMLLQVYRNNGGTNIIISEGYFDVSGYDTEYLIESIDYSLRVRDSLGNYYPFGTANIVQATTRYLYTSTINMTPTDNYPTNNIARNFTFQYPSANCSNLSIRYSDAGGYLSNISAVIYDGIGTTWSPAAWTNVNSVNYSATSGNCGLNGFYTNTTYYLKWSIYHSRLDRHPMNFGQILPGSWTGFNISGFPAMFYSLFATTIILLIIMSLGSPSNVVPLGIISFAVWGIFMFMGWIVLTNDQLAILIMLLALATVVAYVRGGER